MLRKPRRALYRKAKAATECLAAKRLGKPDTGNPSVRFDEGSESDGHWRKPFNPSAPAYSTNGAGASPSSEFHPKQRGNTRTQQPCFPWLAAYGGERTSRWKTDPTLGSNGSTKGLVVAPGMSIQLVPRL